MGWIAREFVPFIIIITFQQYHMKGLGRASLWLADWELQRFRGDLILFFNYKLRDSVADTKRGDRRWKICKMVLAGTAKPMILGTRGVYLTHCNADGHMWQIYRISVAFAWYMRAYANLTFSNKEHILSQSEGFLKNN